MKDKEIEIQYEALVKYSLDECFKNEISYGIFEFQPERSKREDSIVSEIKSDIHAKMMKPIFDAYEMRCSEHCGNTVRDK